MADLASVLGSPYRQTQRLLRLSFPDGDAPSATDPHGRTSGPAIVIERLVADEALSRDFRYELSLLADSAGIALKDMMGKLLAVSLVRPDGSLRWFTGHVTEFSLTGSDAGIARYSATLRPWLWFATLRINDRVCRDQSLQQQTRTLFEVSVSRLRAVPRRRCHPGVLPPSGKPSRPPAPAACAASAFDFKASKILATPCDMDAEIFHLTRPANYLKFTRFKGVHASAQLEFQLDTAQNCGQDALQYRTAGTGRANIE